MLSFLLFFEHFVEFCSIAFLVQITEFVIAFILLTFQELEITELCFKGWAENPSFKLIYSK